MPAPTERRNELKRLYKEQPPAAGIFRVRNTVNGRFLLGSALNPGGALNGHRFQLLHGSHRNRALQADWNEHGADAFVFEVLQTVEPSDAPGFDPADELALLEELWIDELRPFDGGGYNDSKRIRRG